MKSFIAALRTLVLPFGATTGRRIVLDGITGVISIYNAANALVMEIEDTGITLYDGAFPRVQLDTASGAIFTYNNAGQVQTRIDEAGMILYENAIERIILDAVFFAGVSILTGDVAEDEGGGISASSAGTTPNKTSQGIFAGPSFGNSGMQVRCVNRENAATSPLLRLTPADYTGSGRPIVDITSPLGSEPLETWTVVDEIAQGASGGGTAAPTVTQSYPRGLRASPTWKFEKTTDTALSTTNGTYTSIITTGNVALKAGRLYRITGKVGAYLISAGSGWAVTDTWRVRIYRSIGGGAAATMRTNKALRTNVAASAVSPLPDLVGFFSPSADGNVSFIMEAAKTAGAATVTSTVSVDGGEGYSELAIEDVGACSAALH